MNFQVKRFTFKVAWNTFARHLISVMKTLQFPLKCNEKVQNITALHFYKTLLERMNSNSETSMFKWNVNVAEINLERFNIAAKGVSYWNLARGGPPSPRWGQGSISETVFVESCIGFQLYYFQKCRVLTTLIKRRFKYFDAPISFLTLVF